MKNPTGKQALMVFVVWLVAEILGFSAATDFFSTSPFKREYLAAGYFNIVTTVIVAVTLSNYFRQRKQAKN